ncbi:MAG: hypothetical protein II178_10965 [Selenomonadaceae bacterium]|jgi:hypothetical protein|nr:hypothetical protein [Selenomonadaceae bacterium]MBQ3971305.1 hypothetical protein [Selenomonadaceae bacterium]
MRIGSLSTDKDHIQFLYQISSWQKDKDIFQWLFQTINSGLFKIRQVACRDTWFIEVKDKQAGTFPKESLKSQEAFIKRCIAMEGNDYYFMGQYDKKDIVIGINLNEKYIYLTRRTADTGLHEVIEEKLKLAEPLE